MRKNTKTSSFGSPGRVGHDSTAFYAARLYADQPQAESIEYVEIVGGGTNTRAIWRGSMHWV